MIIELIGWFGTALVITAYALTVMLKNKYSSVCNYLNLLGALLVGINCFKNQAFPSLALNIVWVGIASVGIIQNLIKTERLN